MAPGGPQPQRFDSFQELASFIQNHYSRGSVKNNTLVTLRVPSRQAPRPHRGKGGGDPEDSEQG